MDAKEEGMILGELKSFKDHALKRLDDIENKVDALDKFKIKVTMIMVAVLGGIELAFRAISALGKQ